MPISQLRSRVGTVSELNSTGPLAANFQAFLCSDTCRAEAADSGCG